jgi:hypothetical protein
MPLDLVVKGVQILSYIAGAAAIIATVIHGKRTLQ